MRFHRTLAAAWARVCRYTFGRGKGWHLPSINHDYSHRGPHAGIGHNSPTDGVHDANGNNTRDPWPADRPPPLHQAG